MIRWSTGEYLLEKESNSNVTAICSHGGRLYDARMARSRFSGSLQAGIYDTLADKRVAKREAKVLSLCSHGGHLYDGGVYGLYETLTDTIVKTGRTIQALCSHNGVLYDCDWLIIYETVGNRVVMARNESVRSLCSDWGTLYDSGDYYGIGETLGGKLVLDYSQITYDVKTIINPKGRTKGVQCVYGMISVPGHLAEKFDSNLRAKKIAMGR